ncbi:MAG TPA: hypothetical protein VMU81_17330 [Acetobacteraceae bacterium]|jgi:hypothetical protein|nr:hypothetical protein [Acetobacteraceae bacterium]
MKIPAILVEGVTNAAVTEDGRYMALTLREPSGMSFTLGVPGEEIPHLIDRTARALSDRERILRPDGNAKFVATWWNLIRQGDEGSFVLSLTFGTGGALSFVMTDDMVARLQDTLSCLAGSAAANGPLESEPERREVMRTRS